MAKAKALKTQDPLSDFRNLAFVLLKHLGLTATDVQYDICNYLQHGPKRRIVEGFRGISKSWLTSFLVCFLLREDIEHKILVVSATGGKATDFAQFVLRLLRDIPELAHLYPTPDQRQSVMKFDVAGCKPDQSPSVKAVGVGGQITGSRADTIILDDVEIPSNSDTENKRIKLREIVKEFDAILKPGGQIIVLGTPQCEDTLYKELEKRGYKVRIWPVRYPNESQKAFYGERLSPKIASALEANPALAGTSVEAGRFSEADIEERAASYGRSGFELQFMLDTRLSDRNRYPLRLSDLIVTELTTELGPENLVWAADPTLVWPDLYTIGMDGDRFYRPARIQGSYIPYAVSALHIDPAGRGSDELAYVVTKTLNGLIYLLEAGGLIGGYSPENLQKLADIAAKHKVNIVQSEANFGDGMFTALLQPFLNKTYPCLCEEVKHTKQKELRIIDALEPVMNQHRLVVNADVVRKDHEDVRARGDERAIHYSLFYQLTRVTKQRQALTHDDRLDCLAMAVAYWMESLQRDAQKAMADRKQRLIDEALDSFLSATKGSFATASPTKERKWTSLR